MGVASVYVDCHVAIVVAMHSTAETTSILLTDLCKRREGGKEKGRDREEKREREGGRGGGGGGVKRKSVSERGKERGKRRKRMQLANTHKQKKITHTNNTT